MSGKVPATSIALESSQSGLHRRSVGVSLWRSLEIIGGSLFWKRTQEDGGNDMVARATSGTSAKHLPAWVAVVVACSLFALGACSASVSTTKSLNTGKAEETIRADLESKAKGAPVGEVQCPQREAKQGDVFDCTAQVDNQPLRITVTQDNDKGSVSFKRAQAIIDVQEAVALVAGQVQKQGGVAVNADCGSRRLLVKDPGTTFDCQVTPKSGGAPRRVVVTVKDVEGNVDLRLA